MTVAAILLAAGESTRMGRPKALLPWGDATLIEYQVQELSAAGVESVAVVLGHAADEVRPSVPAGPSTGSGQVRVVVNTEYREGRASSLRAGAAALPDSVGPILVLNVDQPRPRAIIRALLEAHGEGSAAITLPVWQGKRGHPVVLAGALLPELRAASEKERGLRGILDRHADGVREIDLGSEVVRMDINTPEEYERARNEWGSTTP
ncbi:MAG: nucleotidyltransferase family protein [Dehalococcoidia bacterium]